MELEIGAVLLVNVRFVEVELFEGSTVALTFSSAVESVAEPGL